MKKVLKISGIIIGVLLLIVLAYVAYLLIDYHREEDNLPLEVTEPASGVQAGAVPTGETLSITSWNIGFGAYTDQYSFFMDGGEHSRGFSKEIVEKTVEQISDDLVSFDSDFYFLQEVDTDATRSYHLNEYEMIASRFDEKYKIFAQNYDSSYLFYPILEPHGKSQAGISTMSDYPVNSSVRRSLPIQSGLAKFFDLDRCYSISRLPAADGKELVLINFHLSAYTTDPTVAEAQLAMMYEDMTAEYKAGNYVICGGDFNKDLLGDSSEVFGVSGEDYSWAQPFPYDSVPEGFTVVAPFDEENPVPSCRNADKPWDPETNFQLTIDGFIISDNVRPVSSDVVDLQFACSDHNPVYMDFILEN